MACRSPRSCHGPQDSLEALTRLKEAIQEELDSLPSTSRDGLPALLSPEPALFKGRLELSGAAFRRFGEQQPDIWHITTFVERVCGTVSGCRCLPGELRAAVQPAYEACFSWWNSECGECPILLRRTPWRFAMPGRHAHHLHGMHALWLPGQGLAQLESDPCMV